MKKIFVISWYFPPINSSEGLVTFKLLKNSKFEYDVFTQNQILDWTYGDQESLMTSKNITHIFAKSTKFNDWVEEGINYYLEHKDEYSFIMSRAMPPESHEMALRIKEMIPETKWIASFGDVLKGNPYVDFFEEDSPYRIQGIESGEHRIRYIFSPKRILKNWLWKYRQRRDSKKDEEIKAFKFLEEETLKKADKIILNNEYQLDYMLETNEGIDFKDKTIILYHSYDLEFYPDKNTKEANKITISYLGHLDIIRNPSSFLKAVNHLNHNIDNLESKLSIDFYGDMDKDDQLYIVQNYLTDIVHFKKPVEYFKSLEIMKNSDWLLSIDANFGDRLKTNIFFPAKLADYLGSNTRIFGITMLDGISADILRNAKQIVCSHSEDEIYLKLKMIIEGTDETPTPQNINSFNVKSVSKIYDDAIEQWLL